jgi:hypothetical protein
VPLSFFEKDQQAGVPKSEEEITMSGWIIEVQTTPKNSIDEMQVVPQLVMTRASISKPARRP